MKKFELLAATAFVLIAAPAAAQDTSAAPAGQASADDDFQSANDIVVTATRRNETVQEVPVAITAVGADLLQDAGVKDIRGLEQLAPSLQSSTGQSSATGTTLYIRGITTAGDNPGFEPAVGVFIDGVFRARAGIAVSELPELQRVEVLRGPQGTLFGRNTSAGALSIFTAQPEFKLGGYVEGSYGNYNSYGIKGAITGPVSEQLALRLDAGYRKRDGYIHDANSDRSINDVNRFYVRGQALYDSGSLTFRLIGDYYETDEQCCGAVSVVRGPLYTALVQSIATPQGRTGIYTGSPSDRIQAISPGRDYSERVRDYGISGELNADIGDLKLTSITAYRSWRGRRNQDIDFSGIDRAYRDGYLNEIDDFTQEVRLQGSVLGGALDFLIGGFYLNETNKLRDTVRFGTDGNRYVDSLFSAVTRSATLPTGAQFYGSLPGVPLISQVLLAGSPQLQAAAAASPALFAYLNTPQPGVTPGQGNNDDNFRVKTDAFALFTHNIINITDQLSLTLGARYNHERKAVTASINNNTGSCGFFTSADPRAATLRGAIQASPLGQLYPLLFLFGCNPQVNSEFNGNYADDKSEDKVTGTVKLAYKVSPDILTYASYDRGYKSGGYNLDQGSFDSRVLGGNGAQGSDMAFNSESVDAYEIGVKTSLSREFTLNVAGFYQKFKDLQSLVFSGTNFVVQNVPSTISKGVEIEATVQPVRELVFRMGYSYIDARYASGNSLAGTPLAGQEGRQLQNQPKNTISVSGTWTPELTSTLNALFHVDGRYNSEVNIPSGTPNPITGRAPLFNPGYPLIGARVGIQSKDRRRSIELFVENLTNQYYHVTGFAVPEQSGIPGQAANYAAYPAPPRFYGINARFGF